MADYVGFAISDSMFEGDVSISRRKLSPAEAKRLMPSALPCVNPSHTSTIDALKRRYGIDIAVPQTAPVIKLEPGDRLVVIGVRGLPRLEGRHEYTQQEIEAADFGFSLWEVHPPA